MMMVMNINITIENWVISKCREGTAGTGSNISGSYLNDTKPFRKSSFDDGRGTLDIRIIKRWWWWRWWWWWWWILDDHGRGMWERTLRGANDETPSGYYDLLTLQTLHWKIEPLAASKIWSTMYMKQMMKLYQLKLFKMNTNGSF